MTYNILAINPGHNGSVALVCDGKLEFYIEEERLSRSKYDGNPFLGMLSAIKDYKIDHLVIGGTGQEQHRLPWTGENSYEALVRKHYPDAKITYLGNDHHIGHVCSAFFNSGFDTAVAVVVDGSGSIHKVTPNRFEENPVEFDAYETETIIKCSYDRGFERILKRFANNFIPKFKIDEYDVDSAITTVKAYEAVTAYLGFGFIEAGKTMGLAPYGREDDYIPDLLVGEDKRGDKNVFIPNYPAGAFIDTQRYPVFPNQPSPEEWHKDPSKITSTLKNLAWKIQKETQEYVGDLIQLAVDKTGEDNVVIAGGYGLNCVANYYYKERFPDLNIFVDPVSHDGGTSIGLAKLAWYEYLRVNEIEEREKDPLTTLYLGLKHNYTAKDLESFDNIEIQDTTAEKVAELIKDRNIVCIYQGRSEAGPRALGNRSILYDPTDSNGKDYVNTVKGREWFRPFAGTVLQEDASEWFDLRGMEESPFMLYAVDLTSKKIGEIPAITHVDGTCRIQTVTKEQNPHYYELINQFKKLTGVPVLFNTSFNLAGEPLVETLEDAINTLKNSDIKYLYLPELKKLVTVDYKVVKTTDSEQEES
jgi:carbamoyltransferase